ncbi:hypothetical protein [Bacillus sp. FJAT-27445]|uniref:hypothetical protein n=1 Tax=Bacillus sp. FJAT-27445 TaxID=1679166 RepID=UPI0012E38428|nr:hypothetical protein [Bacillus sp. FJAT-27445]
MRRIIVSFFIIMSIMFVQSGPWLIGAFAWGEWNNGPQWNGPVWNNAPQWENSTWKTAPQWVDPAWKTVPEWQDPAWQTAPEWQDPSWKTAPEWQNPGQQTGPQWQNPGQQTGPQWQNPGQQTGPQWQNPGQQTGPQWQNPGGNGGQTNGQLPGGNTSAPPGEAPGGNNGTTVTPGGSGDEGPPKTYIDSPWYKAGKVVGKNVIMGSVDEFAKNASPYFLNWPRDWQKTAANNTIHNMDWNRVAEKSFLAVLAASITGKDDGSKIALATLDSFTAVDNYKTVQGYFKTKDEIKTIWNASKATGSFSNFKQASALKQNISSVGDVYSQITKGPSKLTTGIGGKIAPWTAGISLVISAGEAYSNFKKGETTKGVANIGEMLMSGAVIASATGVGAPIAAGMAVAGGLLWAGAKLYQHRHAISAFVKNPVKGIRDGAKAVMDGASRIAKGIGNIGKTIGSWF